VSTSRVKSSARRSATHPVLVPVASSGCIEYGRLEAQRHAAGTAEGLADLLQHLVGAVRRPHLRRVERHARARREVRREVAAQRQRLAVGVAVQGGAAVATAATRSATSDADGACGFSLTLSCTGVPMPAAPTAARRTAPSAQVVPDRQARPARSVRVGTGGLLGRRTGSGRAAASRSLDRQPTGGARAARRRAPP
jgi:hypothetical protein